MINRSTDTNGGHTGNPVVLQVNDTTLNLRLLHRWLNAFQSQDYDNTNTIQSQCNTIWPLSLYRGANQRSFLVYFNPGLLLHIAHKKLNIKLLWKLTIQLGQHIIGCCARSSHINFGLVLTNMSIHYFTMPAHVWPQHTCSIYSSVHPVWRTQQYASMPLHIW
jgi:hypothetical protein